MSLGTSVLPLDPDALEAPLAALDALPRGLWLSGIVNSLGPLPRRLDALDSWRMQLLAGALPTTAADWAAGPVLPLLRGEIEALKLPDLCAGRAELVDQVVRTMLWHIDRLIDYRETMDEATAARTVAEGFRDEWEPIAQELQEVLRMFADLGDVFKFEQWDLTRGLLHSAAWQELLHIRAQLEQLDELRQMIRRLGRARQTEEPDLQPAPAIEAMEKVTTAVTEWRETHVPDLPAETRGIERSGRVSRMLPSEAQLLPHPRLRLIWFARHAERTLLAYEDSDILREPISILRETWRPMPRPQAQRRLEMGPMVICVDTSGSMRGGPETVAKALVLEAMRVAHAQRRACYVYCFSGPEEIIEHELPLDGAGLSSLLAFMSQSFNGGTDITEPLTRALARIESEAWQFADLLIATDGEFGATAALVQRLESAKTGQGLRVQGVLIADRETIGLREIADDVYQVSEWRRFTSADSSVSHDRNMTMKYFPGALRYDKNLKVETAETAAALVRIGVHQGESGAVVPPSPLADE